MAEQPVHSPLGASSAERWMNCPGSVELIKHLNLPETDEPDYRKEGTAAHSVATSCMGIGGDAWECMGTAYEGVVCDQEMADAVQVYLDVCRSLVVPQAMVLLEQRLSSPKHAMMYGTVDFACVADSLLNIVDYKHGVGVAVDVEDNPQLKYYAYLVLQSHPNIRRVVLRIVQPRGFHVDGPVRRWETTAEAICEWVEQTLVPAMLATELDRSLDAGPWCRFCPAKLVCPMMSSLFGAACTANPKNVVNLSDAGLGRSYQYVQAVKQYLAAMEAETLRRLNTGATVPGTKLVYKKANRVWKEGAREIFTGRWPELAMTSPELKSPAEMEKVDPAAKTLVREYAYTPQTGLTVALDSDPRVGVKVQTSQEAFGDVLKDDIPAFLDKRTSKE